MTLPGIEQRRSDRLAVTIPVRVEGVDPNGDTVEYEGRAQGLNRHGARLKIPWPLDCAHPVRVRTAQRAPKVAEFRLVSIGPQEAQDGEYGIECLDENKNFWGIEFPPAEEQEEADARVLLQCTLCRTMALFSMSVHEIETLRTLGMIGKPCRNCAKESLWRYASLAALEGRTNRMLSTARPPDRSFQRVYMEVTVEVHDREGNVEVTRTQNVSKTGFCFTSIKRYAYGEMVMTVFPFDPITKRTELPARIVRARPIEGSNRNFYGARFEALPGSKNRMA
jgi:hypothetical protein